VSSSELFRTLNTSLGVVGGQRTFDSRPAVIPPFIACRTVPALVLLCSNFVVLYNTDLCSFIKLSFLYVLVV